jgi:hypothetical protein
MKLFIVFLILVCALIFVQVERNIAIGTALTMFWNDRWRCRAYAETRYRN